MHVVIARRRLIRCDNVHPPAGLGWSCTLPHRSTVALPVRNPASLSVLGLGLLTGTEKC